MADKLQSKWGALSEVLLASVYAVDPTGAPDAAQPVVLGPITDATIESTANWQSPFEQMGFEAKIPAIMAMIQTGAASSALQWLLGKPNTGPDAGLLDRLNADVQDFARTGWGRSGMTKLNSTQVFTGSPPVKMQLTMHFRAFDDAKAEVQAPVDQLMRWHLARELAEDGNIVSAFKDFQENKGFLKRLLPSVAPQMVALTFGGYTFSPMVLENISFPLTVPRTRAGDPVRVAVQMSLATLTALDANDWRRSRAGKPIKLFNNT